MDRACSRREVPGPLKVPITHRLTDRCRDSLERVGSAPGPTRVADIALVGGTIPGEFSNGTTNMEPWRCTVPMAGISGNLIPATAGR